MTSPDVALPTSDAQDRQDEAPVDDPDMFGQRRRVRPLQIVAVLAVMLFAVVIGRVLTASPDLEVNGDEASYVYSALSLRGFDLSFDAVDQARWHELGWSEQPIGLFLQQFDGGWAMAKPIGASVLLAPSLYLFGLHGIQVTGALLLTAYAACWYLSSRLRWRREVSAIVAVAATVGSHAWFFAFVAHPDLFFAVLIGVVSYSCLRAAMYRDARWFWVATVPAGLLVTEKSPAFLALLPMIGVTASLLRRRPAAIGIGILLVVGALSTLPYWYYSDGASWSPYGGERYYVEEITPWSGGGPDDVRRVATDEKLSPAFVAERVGSPSAEMVDASFTYVIGRHTGAVTFLPLAPVIAAAGAITLVMHSRRRQTVDSLNGLSEVGSTAELDNEAEMAVGDSDTISHSAASEHTSLSEKSRDPSDLSQSIPVADPSRPEVGDDAAAGLLQRPTSLEPPAIVPRLAWAAVASLVLYAAFYIVLLTNNYYGGGQTIGNRYFLQFSLVAIVVPVAAGLRERGALWCAAFAGVWAIAVLGPLLPRGDVMFNEFWRTSSLQRLLPYDGTQVHATGFWTGAIDRAAIGGPFGYPGADALSQTGRVVADSIIAEEGRDEPGFVAFGPYRRMLAGDYVVTFEYSSSASPDETVALMDVSLNGGSIEAVELSGTEGELTVVSIPFTATTANGWEFRILWNGTGGFTLRSVEVQPAEG